MNYLAQCFAKRRMFDLAPRTLQNALKEKLVFDDEKKELIYNLGCVLESMGKKDEAIEQFKLIYEVDIGYKDVAAKVDALLRRRTIAEAAGRASPAAQMSATAYRSRRRRNSAKASSATALPLNTFSECKGPLR